MSRNAEAPENDQSKPPHGAVPLVTMAKARAQLDRLAQARRELRPGGQQLPAYCQRAAELWAAEARVWSELPKAPDFPLGTPTGSLLTHAAELAARYADARAVSWWTTSGRDQPPVGAS